MKKILTPIMNSADIDVLNPDKYNTEFFCGYLPSWWVEEYNDSLAYSLLGNLSTPINNRNGKDANVTSENELREIVRKTKKYGTNLFLVINAKYYPEYVYPALKKYLDEIVSIGITRVIVSDLGLVQYLLENYPDINVSISCLSQATNRMAVRFYTQFKNVDRIVFPRHMSSAEVIEIANEYPNMEFEYFIFSNKCLYDDGYCRGVHEFTPICKDNYFTDYYSKSNNPLSDESIQIFRESEHCFREWTRNEIQSEEKGYCTAGFGCMACSLLHTNKYCNIVSVKISIRGHSVQERLRQVQMAHSVLESVDMNAGIDTIQSIVSSFYGKKSLCKDGKSCMME